MLKYIWFAAGIILIAGTAFSQTTIKVFGSTIVYQTPDTSEWTVVRRIPPGDGRKGVILFQHAPIKDDENRMIKPDIGLIYEQVPDSVGVIMYSMYGLGNTSPGFTYKIAGGYPDYSSDKHAAVFTGKYVHFGVRHSVVMGFIVHNGIGIEIIGDATTSTYQRVSADFFDFVKSVYVK